MMLCVYELYQKVFHGIGRRLFSSFMRSQFAAFGKKSLIYRPLKLLGMNNIWIGHHVIISEFAWLQATPLVAGCHPRIEIGNGSYIGHFSHIVAVDKIIIGSDVLIANKVYISDNTHGYEDTQYSVIDQPVKYLSQVSIGDGSWIGENVCISGAKIGIHCVIGANSVVRCDIPDYCVAVGSPARIVKKYNLKSNVWERGS